MRRDVTFEQFAAIRRYGRVIALSPDGSEVLYVVDTSGQFNLWAQSIDGGCPRQITLFENQSVRDAVWSPDGESIIFTADRAGDEFTQIYRIPTRGGRVETLVSKDQVQHYLGDITPDGARLIYSANDREPTEQDILTLDLASGQSRRLLADGGTYYGGLVSPDGARAAVIDSISNTNLRLLVVGLDGSDPVEILPHPDEEFTLIPCGWSADGQCLYVLSNQPGEFTGLCRIDIASQAVEWLETPEHDIENAVVSGDGSRLIWSVNEDGYSRVFTKLLEEGAETDLVPLPDGVLAGLGISRDGEVSGALLARAVAPTEVFVGEKAWREVRQLTTSALGGLSRDDFTDAEPIRFPSFDREVPAWLFKPADSGGKIPVVLSIHGGPEAQERPVYIYSGMYQYLTSQGIAVLAPNIRGSTGYGTSYQKLIHRDWGGDELKDLEHAVKWLLEQDWVDPERIAVYGGSFGGFATLSCLTRLPDYWACGVDLVGPSNLATFAKAVPPTWKRMMAAWVGDPDTEEDFLLERSPITYAHQIKAPVFVLQGANDPRVVKSESDQIVEIMRDQGVDVRYDVYEDEGHGFTKRSNQLKANQDIVEYLIQHLLPENGETAAD